MTTPPTQTQAAPIRSTSGKFLCARHVGAETGSANVHDPNVAPVPTAYIDGQIVIIQKAAFDNNGPMTGNIERLGTRPIVNMDGTTLAAKQWPASATGILDFNNATTSFRLLNPAVTVAQNAGLDATDQQVLYDGVTFTPPAPPPPVALTSAYWSSMARSKLETTYDGRRASLASYYTFLERIERQGSLTVDQKADLADLDAAQVWEQAVLEAGARAATETPDLSPLVGPTMPTGLTELIALS
jgi:hypothetical protein